MKWNVSFAEGGFVSVCVAIIEHESVCDVLVYDSCGYGYGHDCWSVIGSGNKQTQYGILQQGEEEREDLVFAVVY